jgi:hypothetical protein
MLERENMTPAQKTLLKGALKSAVSSATGIVLSLNLLDQDHFSVATIGGWKRLVFAVAVSVLVAEARYWRQWAESGESPQSPITQAIKP